MSNRHGGGHMPPPPVKEKPVEVVEEQPPVEIPQPEEVKEPQAFPASHSEKIIPVSKKGIEVVAVRAGYFKCMRKVEGDKFIVPNMDQLGSWMKCVDGKVEAEHQRLLKEKKKAGK